MGLKTETHPSTLIRLNCKALCIAPRQPQGKQLHCLESTAKLTHSLH